MKRNLFRSDIKSSCEYCANCRKDNNSNLICTLGVTYNVGSDCGLFLYDPLKRKPRKKNPSLLKYKAEDFTL